MKECEPIGAAQAYEEPSNLRCEFVPEARAPSDPVIQVSVLDPQLHVGNRVGLYVGSI